MIPGSQWHDACDQTGLGRSRSRQPRPDSPAKHDAADQTVPRRRQACFRWINSSLVGSTVVIGPSDHRVGSCVHVDSGGVYSGYSYFGARQDRSGHAERKDSGDDDCSPDAHGFLHGECPGQRVSWRPRRYFHVTWSIVSSELFHARLQSKFFLFLKLQSLRQLPLPLYGQDSLLRVRKD